MDYNREDSQYVSIRGDLMAGLSITPLEALNRYGCMRLAAVIHRLREDGHRITTEMVTTPEGKRFARYRMDKPVAEQPMLPFDDNVGQDLADAAKALDESKNPLRRSLRV